MILKNRNHIYETLPPFLDNRKASPDQQIVLGLKVASLPEQDMYQREALQVRAEFALDKAQELIEEKTRKFVEDHFAFVRGLIIEGINDDGRELTFAQFYAEAPPEIVNWTVRAIMSTTELTLAERKNFVPASATA